MGVPAARFLRPALQQEAPEVKPLFKNQEPGEETLTFKRCSQRGDLEKEQRRQPGAGSTEPVSHPPSPAWWGWGGGLCAGCPGPGWSFLILRAHLSESPAKARCHARPVWVALPHLTSVPVTWEKAGSDQAEHRETREGGPVPPGLFPGCSACLVPGLGGRPHAAGTPGHGAPSEAAMSRVTSATCLRRAPDSSGR